MFQNIQSSKPTNGQPFQAFKIQTSKQPIISTINTAITKIQTKPTGQTQKTTQSVVQQTRPTVPLKTQQTNVAVSKQPVNSPYPPKKTPTQQTQKASIRSYDQQDEPAQKRLKTNAYPTMQKPAGLTQQATPNKPVDKLKVDSSLKIFTVTIDNLRQYSEYQKTQPILFEVFGKTSKFIYSE
jgi:hypothetical protein